MDTKPVCLLLYCYYLLLASDVSSVKGITYPAKSSSQCGQGNPLQNEQFVETLSAKQKDITFHSLICAHYQNKH